MKFKSMDEVELEISNIHDIVSISFTDMTIVSAGKPNNKTYQRTLQDGDPFFIPNLIVVYDGSKCLNLTSYDKHFPELVKKVREVYLKEKDRPIPGFINEMYINIDDYTKKILLSDSIIKTSNLYSFYKDKTGYDEELISKEKEIYGLLPLISHIIDINLFMFGKHFKSLNEINGFGPRGNYILYGEINNIYTPIPFIVNKINNNSYNFKIGKIFDELVPIDVSINFNKTNLDIVCKVPKYDYNLFETYTYDDGKLISNRDVFWGEELHYSKQIEVEKLLEVDNISNVDISKDAIDDEFNKLDWFLLPWGAKIGFKFIDENIDEETKTSSRKIQYIDINKNVFINLASAENRLIRRTKDFRMARDIVFDDVDKTMVGYRDDGITYISTLFGDDGATGEYRNNYAGRCFYHVTVNDFNNLNSSDLYPVGYDFDIYEQGDLLENNKIKNKVMGS